MTTKMRFQDRLNFWKLIRHNREVIYVIINYHKPSQTFKGANDYDKHKNYINYEKEKFINT